MRRTTCHALVFGMTCGCAEAAPCPSIGCAPSVTLAATLAWQGEREFEVRLCRDDACAEYVVTEPERGTSCSRGSESSVLCLQRATSALRFEATWWVDTAPGASSFRLRIEDRANGEVLLEETREARTKSIPTDPGECARCDHVTVELNRG
jgi:hypothetical protein